jgi:hypothetical protein
MARRLILALSIAGVIGLFATDANAGCIGNPPYCAAWITGSGMPTGLFTAAAAGGVAAACPAVATSQDGAPICNPDVECCTDCDIDLLGTTQLSTNVVTQLSTDAVSFRLVGTVPTNSTPCGLNQPSQSETCDIAGVAICNDNILRQQTTPGPLRVDSPNGFGQTDQATDVANYRFQIGTEEQERFCGAVTNFLAFVAREGFFEACAGTNCVKEFCKVDMGGIRPDVPRVYNCTPVP